MLNQSKSLLKLLRLFVIGSLLLFAITGGCIVYFTIQNALNSKRITDAQVKVYQAQVEQQGKPTVIEQRYFAPTK